MLALAGRRSHPPRMASFAARPASYHRSADLICAPAGFGKTMLMQQLRQRYQARDVTIVWLQLDRADNEHCQPNSSW
jgi:ATP/maltotriose-dependent transcriptional regulator MalT